MPSQALIEAMLGKQPTPPPAPQPTLPSQALIDAMLAKPPGVISEDESYRQMSPIDRLAQNMPSNWAPVSEEQAAANGSQNLRELLSMLPVTGNVMAARDAYDNAGQVVEASKAGDIRGQRKAAAMTGLSLLGAMSPLPWGGAARRAAEGAASRTNIFAGPSAKTANHVALMRAQEMEGQGIPRDEIWKATGWGKGVDGKWRWEIDDSGTSLKGGKGARSRFTGLEHPDLEAEYGRLAPVHGLYAPGLPETGSYQSMRVPYVAAQGRNPESAKSVTLHEFQHGAQDAEGFAMGANPKQFNSRGDLMAALERAKANDGLDPVTGDFDVAIQSRLRHAVDDAYEAYRRVAGEVEARNVQSRMNMTAAQRRTTPPWSTQDVPDEHQILLKR